jgi:nitroreductase
VIPDSLSLPKTLQSLLNILRGKPKTPGSLKDNALLQVILTRRSVRSFTNQPVEEDEFNAILEAGRLAPCTVNLQSWSFAPFDQEQWHATFGRNLPLKADRAVMVISDLYRIRQTIPEFPDCPLTEYTLGVINASLAAMNMNLAAEALGISSVMLSETGQSGFLDAQYLKEKLGLPDGAIPLMTIVFGHARGGKPPMPPKLPMEQILISGNYQASNPVVMQDWLNQMIAGYNVSHSGSTFRNQLQIYEGKISQAEGNLNQLVFYPRK